MPPVLAEMPSAMGVVTDLGWSDVMTSCGAPSSRQMMMTLTMPTTLPAKMAHRMAMTLPLIRSICRWSVKPSATTDGPSRKLMKWLPRSKVG